MAVEISTKVRRSLGIGYIGLAHYLDKKGYSYEQKLGWRQVDKLTEAFQFYLLKSSNELAKEKGQCEYFNRTKYCDGILPIDTYKKEVDEVVTRNLTYDWEWLRKEIKDMDSDIDTLCSNDHQNPLVWFQMLLTALSHLETI